MAGSPARTGRLRRSEAAPEAAPLTLVIPVRDEGANFPRLWEGVSTTIHAPFLAFVVYDSDDDDTVPVVREIIACGETRLRLIRNRLGDGVAGALRTAFSEIERGPVVVTMADLSDDLSLVDSMVGLYRAGYHVVVASRYMPGGSLVGAPPLKQGLSRLAGLSLHWLRGIPTHDATNSFKLYDRAMLADLDLESTAGFEISLEITVKAFLRRYRIAEIPTTWRERTSGQSSFRLWAWLPRYLRWYLDAFRPRRPAGAREGSRRP